MDTCVLHPGTCDFTYGLAFVFIFVRGDATVSFLVGLNGQGGVAYVREGQSGHVTDVRSVSSGEIL